MRAAAEQHGFRYLSRPDRGYFKKAGNLRFGFEHSDGDLILIFDADFVPAAGLPRRTSCRTSTTTTVGIVQSPQYFDARDADELAAAGGRRHPGALLPLGAAVPRPLPTPPICVGTCALYRRAALDRGRRLRADRPLRGRAHRRQPDAGRLSRPVRAGPRRRRACAPTRSTGSSTSSTAGAPARCACCCRRAFHVDRLIAASAALLLVRVPLLHHHRRERVRDGAPADPDGLVRRRARDSRPTTSSSLLAMVARQSVVPLITFSGVADRPRPGPDVLLLLPRAGAVRRSARTHRRLGRHRRPARSRTAERVHRLTRWWCIGCRSLLWVAIVGYVPVFGLANYSLMIASPW